MKNSWTVGFHPHLPHTHSHRGFCRSPNTSPPIDRSSAAHRNSLKVRGIREKKNSVGTIKRYVWKREKAKNKWCSSRARHDWADWFRPDLAQTARLSEIRAKMMYLKAGDPWAFLNHQVPLSQHKRRHPRQTGGSCFNRELHPIH